MTGARFDAVMLSYDEPLADKLHARLQRVLGSRSSGTPAVRDEAGRLLDHTDRHGGRIDVADPASPSAA